MSETIGDATTGIYGTPNPTNEISETPAQESVPENPLRTTKPGSKRLILTLTVLFSFISGLPFLFKSTEIYRSPLPFESIDSLLKRLDSSPVSLPCGFQVVYIGFDLENFDELMAEKLGFEISERMTKLCGDGPVCGGCDSNFTVSVTVDLGGDCKWGWSADSSCLWQCGAIDFSSVDDNLKDDEKIDGVLDSILRGNGDCGDRNKVYSVVVMNRKELEELRVVVGKYRHAWMVGRIGYRDVVTLISDVFVRWFVKGGKEDGMVQGTGEFMPVGADGSVVLSFSLLNSNPNDWIYDWDFQKIDELLLAPVVEALAPIANISVESQVLYHTPKSSFSYWDEELSSYIFSTGVLPFFVNSNEWHLDTSVTAAGRSKILQFVVYIPSASECPLLLQLPNGDISMTNGFISPMWGGVIVWNPPRCLRESQSKHAARHTFSPQDLQMVFQVFMGQLRQLFGLKSDNLHAAQLDISKFLASERGFTEWELDVLYRHHTCFNLHSCATTLGSLSRLVQSLPRMIVMDEIGKQVKFSLEAASLAQKNASLGIYHASAVSSRQARTLAEDAFFHPSIMSLSYSSIEHYFAIYMPFFAPVLLHIILAALKELRRYKREQAKYSAWCAQTRAA